MFTTKRCLALFALAAFGAVATAQVNHDKTVGPMGSGGGKVDPRGDKGTKVGDPFDSADGKIAPRGGKGTKIGKLFDSPHEKFPPPAGKETGNDKRIDSPDGRDVPTADIGYPICFGDDTGQPCPFKNPGMKGRGCENSLGLGGGLFWADGVPRVSQDTVKLRVDFLPNATTIFFLQGSGCRNKELGFPFGDGLMCMGGSVIRLGVVSTKQGRAEFPALFGPSCSASVSGAGMIPPSGGERYYQALYRDKLPIGKKAGFNLTNAWSMTWAP